MITITVDWTWWVLLVMVFDITIRVAAIIIIPRNRRPTAAMAWLLAIYFIPLIGVFLFLLIGNPRLPRIDLPGMEVEHGRLTIIAIDMLQ